MTVEFYQNKSPCNSLLERYSPFKVAISTTKQSLQGFCPSLLVFTFIYLSLPDTLVFFRVFSSN